MYRRNADCLNIEQDLAPYGRQQRARYYPVNKHQLRSASVEVITDVDWLVDQQLDCFTSRSEREPPGRLTFQTQRGLCVLEQYFTITITVDLI